MRAAFAAALLLAASAARAGDRGAFFLAGRPVDAPAGIDLGAPMTAILVLTGGGEEHLGSLKEWFPEARISDGAVALPLPAPTSLTAVAPEHRASSFVIDFDEPALAPVRAELTKAGGRAATIGDLEQLVDRWVVRKNLNRLFDPASVVAARREGDCTEHAVLLAAVARLAGRPSRVVLGLALLKGPSGPVALGHAWTEIHDGSAWRVGDAAAHGLAGGVRYIPMAVLRDEGPGYLSDVWKHFSPLYLRTVRLEPVAPSSAVR